MLCVSCARVRVRMCVRVSVSWVCCVKRVRTLAHVLYHNYNHQAIQTELAPVKVAVVKAAGEVAPTTSDAKAYYQAETTTAVQPKRRLRNYVQGSATATVRKERGSL